MSSEATTKCEVSSRSLKVAPWMSMESLDPLEEMSGHMITTRPATVSATVTATPASDFASMMCRCEADAEWSCYLPQFVLSPSASYGCGAGSAVSAQIWCFLVWFDQDWKPSRNNEE